MHTKFRWKKITRPLSFVFFFVRSLSPARRGCTRFLFVFPPACTDNADAIQKGTGTFFRFCCLRYCIVFSGKRQKRSGKTKWILFIRVWWWFAVSKWDGELRFQSVVCSCLGSCMCVKGRNRNDAKQAPKKKVMVGRSCLFSLSLSLHFCISLSFSLSLFLSSSARSRLLMLLPLKVSE